MQDADLTEADLSESHLIAVDVTGADFTNAETTNAMMLVEWDNAKVRPADLPEKVKPPAWLPFVFVGVVGLVAVLMLLQRKR